MTQSEEVARSTGGLWTHPDPKAHVMAHNVSMYKASSHRQTCDGGCIYVHVHGFVVYVQMERASNGL